MQNETMIYGYARVSTAAQDESGQVGQPKAAGCESKNIFREKITGSTADRPQLGKLMKRLAPGDVVITPAVDRLSRDTTDLLVIAREMHRAAASIRSLAEPYLDTTSDFAEIIFAILGVAAKLEHCILDRMARGRADAKENSVKFGCKPILTPHRQKEARKRLEAGKTQRSGARSYNVSQSTISRQPSSSFLTPRRLCTHTRAWLPLRCITESNTQRPDLWANRRRFAPACHF
jgi:DNA invertase Pin-like site-specific DNA recombinase